MCGPASATTVKDADGKPVVSGNFLDWAHCPFRASADGWCATCVHRLRHRPYRTQPHRWPAGQPLDPPALRDLLSAPVPAGEWVTVPISRQVHIAFRAGPGWVWTDRQRLPWTAGEADLLGVYEQLRHAGFGETALAEASPRWHVLAKLPDDRRRGVLDLWAQLQPWRDRPDYLDVAARATRPTKEPPDGADDS